MKKLSFLPIAAAILIAVWTLNCGDDGGAACVDNDGDTYGQNCSAGPDCDDDDVDNWESCESCLDGDTDTYYAGCDAYTTRNGPDECDDDGYNWTAAGCADCADSDGDTYRGTDCDLDEDCDDGDFSICPGAPEICDGTDNQCPGDAGYGTVDEGYGGQCGPMTQIPVGCFGMGDNFTEGLPNELPVHNVCISAFKMDVYEVTNAEYKACVDDEACIIPGNTSSQTRTSYYGNPTYNNYPVIWVDWNQATAYCAWADKRLPTEAEWEYAARGELSGKRFPWGDTISCSEANYYSKTTYTYDTEGSTGYCVGDTTEVGSYSANGYGLYDMAGNVLEWVNDWYSATYYQYCVDNSIVNDPPGPVSGTSRMLRGGSWNNTPDVLRASYRSDSNPTFQGNLIGFRCASSGD